MTRLLANGLDECDEAAARIEADAARIAILKGQRDAYREIHQTDAATIVRLEGERDSASGLALTLQAECERLHGDVAAADAKLAALVEALERSADYIEKGMRDRSGPVLRQARAAVTAAKEAK